MPSLMLSVALCEKDVEALLKWGKELLALGREWVAVADQPPPEGEHILLYWHEGERGDGGIECATVYRDGDSWTFWTHGGANSGLDWSPQGDELPSHWMRLPLKPKFR